MDLSRLLRISLPIFAAAAAPIAPAAGFNAHLVQGSDLDRLRAVIDIDRQPQSRSQDWAYAMSLVKAGEAAWRIEKSSSGERAREARRLRSRLFVEAARNVGRWRDRHLGEPRDDFPPQYVYASMLIGIYLDYAGDPWKGLEYLRYAANQMGASRQGTGQLRYSGQPLSLALSRELTRVERKVSSRGSTHPYDRKMHFEMSDDADMTTLARAAIDHAEQTNDDELLGTPPQNFDISEPCE